MIANALVLERDMPPGPPMRCEGCGKFTRRTELDSVHETGDYGQIYSTTFLCQREGCPG